jgi:integrase
MSVERITKRVVDAAKAATATYLVRDSQLKGFVLVVTPYGGKSYAIDYRAGRGRRARKRRLTIGKHGSPWTPDTARQEATKLLGLIAGGADPLDNRNRGKDALTVAELCELYLREGAAHKKASTLRADMSRIKNHIRPLIGNRLVNNLTRADVERFLQDVSSGKSAAQKPIKRKVGSVTTGGKGTAAQCVTLLGTLFAFALRRKLCIENPAHGIKKPPVRKLERFLSTQELKRLAEALDLEERSSGNPLPVAAIKLLLFTGCRKGEILNLKRNQIDFGNRCLRLSDSKTGAKIVYMNEPSVTLLQNLPPEQDNSAVIFGTRGKSGILGIDKVWARVRNAANLSDVRIHDLRHSFASIGVTSGLSLPMLGVLLGHKHASTTARYAHLSDDPIRAANELIGTKIADAMLRTTSMVMQPSIKLGQPK